MATPRDIEGLERLVAADSENPSLQQDLANAYATEGRTANALIRYSRAAELFEQAGEILNCIGAMTRVAELNGTLPLAHPRSSVGGSVPEVVQRLASGWAGLPMERQRELGLRWVDYSVRTMLAEMFESAGHEALAAAVSALPVIDEVSALKPVSTRLLQMNVPDEPVEVIAALFCAASDLDELDQQFSVSDCCFHAVMMSRFRHRDDRVVALMLRDLS